MTNIAELLKDVAKDTELYSPICGHCKLNSILYDDGIRVIAHEVPFRFDKYGRFCSAGDAECLLFPSKEVRTWEGWKLPAEPKFKVGDWVVFNNSHNSIYQISEIMDSYYMLTHIHGGSMPLSFSQEELIRPWTIGDAKDGDILTDGKKIVLFNKLEEPAYKQHIIAYIGLDLCGRLQITEDTWRLGVDKAMPATKEQRDLLFSKMREAGYEWDEKKKLHKIKPHYDILNFKPKQWVLVRDDDEWEWALTRFSHLSNGSASLFVCINGASFQQCIPLDGNEKLLGTTNMCPKEYVNW